VRERDIVTKIFRDAAAHGLGIAPLSYESLRQDMGQVLASLPPEEARKAKRKFRKLWRKAVRRKQQSGKYSHYIQRAAGLGDPHPRPGHKFYRKSEVIRMIEAEIVEPMIRTSQP